MIESEWQESGMPEPMLSFIRERVSPRRMRLYGCACCRLFWTSIKDPGCRSAIIMAEEYADNFAMADNLQIMRAEVRESRRSTPQRLMNAAHAITGEAAWASAIKASRELIQYVWETRGSMSPYSAHKKGAYRQQSDLVRDIFGNPFRPIAIRLDWLTWNDHTVPKLAQTIYDDRRFDLLPILADALEEAGCGNDDILTHCRGPGPHVRGCWVIDLLLGKS